MAGNSVLSGRIWIMGLKNIHTLKVCPYSQFFRRKHNIPRHKALRLLNADHPRMSHKAQFNDSLSFPEIPTSEVAKNIIRELDDNEKDLLLVELNKHKEAQESRNSQGESAASITSTELYHVFLFNGVPFIGFGILDNLIMIVAGEYIDQTLGLALGISTMAAAALGNLISDVAGVGTAGYVEAFSARLGVPHPKLSHAQVLLKSHRWSVALVSVAYDDSLSSCVSQGRGFGISLGCLIGMFPLLFYDKDDGNKKEEPE